MRVILDTNVFVSGIYFTGPPYEILKAWRASKLDLVVSTEILEEYWRVAWELAYRYNKVDPEPLLALVAGRSEFVEAPSLAEPVCEDPDDDKFLACALASGCKVIISGDKALVRTSGYGGITVLRPSQFIERHLREL